jgi:hypothetical protein
MSVNPIALEDQNWQLIKASLTDPDSTALSLEQRYMLDRIVSMARIMDRHPQGRAALNIHMAKYPDISRRTASRDLFMAQELNVSYHSFHFDFWHNWIMNEMVDQVQASRAKGDMKAWAQGLTNLSKHIGERPVAETDPKLVEKHTFLIQILDKRPSRTVDISCLDQYSKDELRGISDAIYTEITEEDALEIFKT